MHRRTCTKRILRDFSIFIYRHLYSSVNPQRRVELPLFTTTRKLRHFFLRNYKKIVQVLHVNQFMTF